MSALDDAPLFQPADRGEWHAWLEANHATARGVWLVSWRSRSGRTPFPYEDAIEEALCFGWVDGTAGRVDDERGKLYFAPRKPRSVWAASNRERVARLEREGRLRPAGIAVIKRAKADGSWSILESAERLEVPPDLAEALAARPPAADEFAAFPPFARKLMLSWVATAVRPETRAARIAKIAEAAERGERAQG